jgi:hypothetical protein
MEILNQFHSDFISLFVQIDNFDDNNKLLLNIRESIIILEQIFIEINREKEKNKEFQFIIINEKILNFLNKIKDNSSIKFEIKLELNKLINKLLTNEYYSFIFENNEKIPYFINSLFSIIQLIRGVLLFDILIRKIHLYIDYLLNISIYKKLLTELKLGFGILITNNLGECKENMEEILDLCSSNKLENKKKGVDILINYINSISFIEKYELINEYSGQILINLFRDISDDYTNLYYKIGKILYNLLISDKFIITENNEIEIENKNQKINLIYNDYLLNTIKDFYILLPYKNYEFYFQKDIIYFIEKIVNISITFLTVIIKFDENFELQYISYIILKRIYFIFPKYRKEINEYIPIVLNKLCQTKDQKQWNIAIGSRQFAYYLLVNDKDLTTKIKSSTEISPIDVKIEPINLLNTELKFGFKNEILIDQGKYFEKIIEVLYDNSLIFLEFNLDSELVGKDIELKFLKFDSEKCVWYYIFKERGSSEKNNKYIIYSRETGLYKMIFDNVYSWITKKKIYYQITLFKPIIEN